jgi:hypothetical protein
MSNSFFEPKSTSCRASMEQPRSASRTKIMKRDHAACISYIQDTADHISRLLKKKACRQSRNHLREQHPVSNPPRTGINIRHLQNLMFMSPNRLPYLCSEHTRNTRLESQ